MYKNPAKTSIVLFVYNKSEKAMRKAQVAYNVEKMRADGDGTLVKTVELPVNFSLEDYNKVLDDLKTNYNIDGFYALVHGQQGTGKVVVGNSLLSLEDLDPKQPSHNGRVVKAVQCYGHHDPLARPPSDSEAACRYQLMFFIEVATDDTCKAREVTWNVRREYVDGTHGWVHTGLNPEVLEIPAVREAIRQQVEASESN